MGRQKCRMLGLVLAIFVALVFFAALPIVVAQERSQAEWMMRAAVLEEAGDWQGMLDWCRQWTKSDPEDADAWHNLGYAYAHLSRYQDAIDAYRQAIRINPEDAWAWENLVVSYALSGNRGAAMDALQELRRLDPASADELFDMLVPRGEPNGKGAMQVMGEWVFVPLITSALWALIAALVVQLGCKIAVKFKPPYVMAYKAVFLGYIATHLVSSFFGYGVGIFGLQFTEITSGFLTVIGFFVQAAVYAILINHPETGAIGFGKACLVSLIHLIFVGLLVVISPVIITAFA